MQALHTSKKAAVEKGSGRARLTVLPGVGLVDLDAPKLSASLAERLEGTRTAGGARRPAVARRPAPWRRGRARRSRRQQARPARTRSHRRTLSKPGSRTRFLAEECRERWGWHFSASTWHFTARCLPGVAAVQTGPVLD